MRFAMSNAMLSKQTVCITPNEKMAILISVRIASWSPIIYVTQILCDLAFAMALFLSRYQKFCHYVWQKCCHFSQKVRQICVYVEKSKEKKINLKPVQHLCHKRRNIGFFRWCAMKIQRKTHAQNELRSCFVWAVRFSCVVFFYLAFHSKYTYYDNLKLFKMFSALCCSFISFISLFFLTTSFQLLFFSFFKTSESLFVSLYAKMLSSNENENAQIDFQQ